MFLTLSVCLGPVRRQGLQSQEMPAAGVARRQDLPAAPEKGHAPARRRGACVRIAKLRGTWKRPHPRPCKPWPRPMSGTHARERALPGHRHVRGGTRGPAGRSKNSTAVSSRLDTWARTGRGCVHGYTKRSDIAVHPTASCWCPTTDVANTPFTTRGPRKRASGCTHMARAAGGGQPRAHTPACKAGNRGQPVHGAAAAQLRRAARAGVGTSSNSSSVRAAGAPGGDARSSCKTGKWVEQVGVVATAVTEADFEA